MGTALGCPVHSPAASFDRSEEVRSVHRAFVTAGARVVLTNTFSGSAPTADECAISLKLARASGSRYVAASLWAGLPGKDLSRAARLLIAAGADAIWLETATSAAQALAGLRAVRGLGPVVVTLAFVDGEVLPKLVEEGASAVGFNCAPWPRAPGELARLAAAHAHLPLVLKPDAVGMVPAEWSIEVAAASRAGARFVGGCCGATPAHLAALRNLLMAQ